MCRVVGEVRGWKRDQEWVRQGVRFGCATKTACALVRDRVGWIWEGARKRAGPLDFALPAAHLSDPLPMHDDSDCEMMLLVTSVTI